jgi:hypothetical protein
LEKVLVFSCVYSIAIGIKTNMLIVIAVNTTAPITKQARSHIDFKD